MLPWLLHRSQLYVLEPWGLLVRSLSINVSGTNRKWMFLIWSIYSSLGCHDKLGPVKPVWTLEFSFIVKHLFETENLEIIEICSVFSLQVADVYLCQMCCTLICFTSRSWPLVLFNEQVFSAGVHLMTAVVVDGCASNDVQHNGFGHVQFRQTVLICCSYYFVAMIHGLLCRFCMQCWRFLM
jgi:hypothetical protein